MGVDETGRNETASGVDFFVHRLGIFFADELDSIVLKYHDTILEDFVFLAVETDDVSALYECFHLFPFPTCKRKAAPPL